MSAKTITLPDDLRSYLLQTTVREDAVLADLRAETAELPNARMQISPEQGQLMTLLVRLCGARRALEIGTFTGYSSICIARGLSDEGRLICCDRSEEWTAIAQRYWARAGLTERIDLRLGAALDTLAALRDAEGDGGFDFAFVDADKSNYDAYYEHLLKLVRPGGLIAFDNALWSGRVLEADSTDEDTRAIRALNEKIGRDERIECSLVPIGDGLLLARRVSQHVSN